MASGDGGYSTATANCEEAARAKEIALQKLQQKDWDAAKRLLLKAQRLCPDLDGVAACIVVAEVHIIAASTTVTSPYREVSRDYYAILDVRPDATRPALIQQYKKRAFQLHPDKNQNPGAEAAFKLLGEAFEILKDDAKRRKYDYQRTYLSRNGQSQAAPPQPRGPAPQGPYARPFGGYTWLPNYYAGGGGPPGGVPFQARGVPAGFYPPPQRAPNPTANRPPPQRPSVHVPRDSSGNAFAGYSVSNGQGRGVPPGRQPGYPGPTIPAAAPQQPRKPSNPGEAPRNPPVQPAPRPVGMQPGASAPQPRGFHPGTFPRPAPGFPQSSFPQQPQSSFPQPGFAQQPGAFPGPSQPPRPVAQSDRYVSTCSSCHQKYTFPVSSKDKWVRCQKCNTAFMAVEDLPAGATGLSGGFAPTPQSPGAPPQASAPPVGSAPPPASAPSKANAPSPTRAAPQATGFTRVEQAWAEAVKLRTDFNKEKKREAKQLQKQEKAEREQEMERLREQREMKEAARRLKAEEKARRHKERDDLEKVKADAEKADADSRLKARKEEERIPTRSGWKPVSIEVTGDVNGLSGLAGGVNGLLGTEAGGPLDKGSGPGLDPQGGKGGERKDGFGLKAGEESDDEPLIRRRVDRKRKFVEMSGDEQEEKKAEAAGDLKGKRVLDGREKRAADGLEKSVLDGREKRASEGREAEGSRGGQEGRKKARVSYIDLSSDEENMVEERPTQSETKRRERGAKEGPDARAEVLPGRAKEKHKLLAEVLSRAEAVDFMDLAPSGAGETETCEPPFLVPAKGVNKPFVQEPGPSEAGPSEAGPSGVGPSKLGPSGAGLSEAVEGRGKTTVGEDSHRPEENNLRPEGGSSHQHDGEAGPSSADGDVPAGDGEQIPDTIFFEFDDVRKEADVQVGQIWALYDEVDGMPRFYGRVDSVERNPFLVDITWLEAMDEEREGFYARDALLRDNFISPGVGKFLWGSSTQFDAINIFAYQQMAALPSEKGAQLFPRCGEVWAMFRLEKQSKRDRKSRQLRYDVVEVVGAEGGYVITKLARLPQHKTLFQPTKGLNGKPFRVSVKPADVHLFSHRVLGRRVPPDMMVAPSGSDQNAVIWELDPAALPLQS